MPTRISELFGIPTDRLDDVGVFDTFVDLDSLLHVDPHLLAASEVPEMQEANIVLERYFEDTIALLEAANRKEGPLWEAAIERLQFGELRGVSLGHSRNRADGAAVGPILARRLADRAFDIIEAGQKNPRIFELVALFTDDYGPDRVSDVVLQVAKEEFARYTSRVASAVGLQTLPVSIGVGTYELPYDGRAKSPRPIIFVPKDVLREIPVALDRSEIARVSTYNRHIRSALNELFAMVARGYSPSKETLWDRVVANPGLLGPLVEAYLAAGGSPYDFSADPSAELGRLLGARKLAAEYPLKLVVPPNGWSSHSALAAVEEICHHFKALVEINGLWDSLWFRDGASSRALSEKAIQRIFFGIALTYCRDGSPDLDISPETNAGPGPVDFKFSHGASIKVTVEMKKSNHSRLVHGYKNQLARYNQAERTSEGIYLVVRFGDHSSNIDAVLEARDRAIVEGRSAPLVIVVDARPQESASKA